MKTKTNSRAKPAATKPAVARKTVTARKPAAARKTAATRQPKPAPKASAKPPAPTILLRLFVAGATVRSRQAILRVRELCAGEMEGHYKLEVIDIYQQPKLARDNQIVATPTLIKELPSPVRRFIGNFANLKGLYLELNLIPSLT